MRALVLLNISQRTKFEEPSYTDSKGTKITACTVVQAVVKATSQSNGKGQILTPGAPKPLNGFR